MDAAEWAGLRRVLLLLALASVIGSGAAFLTGMNMVGAASAERSSSHPKGAKEKPPSSPAEKAPAAPAEKPPAAPTSAPNERVQLLHGVLGGEGPALTQIRLP
jgi:hypothetical protein